MRDVNGDGGDELIIANGDDNNITVLLHNEDYQMVGAPYATAMAPSALSVADINGDKVKDVLVACNNGGGQDLSFLRGNGNGSFTPAVNLAVGLTASGVTGQDFDGDGRIDVAASVRSQGRVYVLTNTSPGASVSFAVPYASYDVGKDPVAILSTDLNRDGRPDLVVAKYAENQIGTLVSQGNGAFASGFQTPIKLAWVGSGPIALVAGELTGDMAPDVVVANFDSNTLSLLPGAGDGTFLSVFTLKTLDKPRAVALADMDQDGKLDIVVANSGANRISVFLGNGDGMFDPPQSFPVGQQPWALVVTDLDLDGKPDVATANMASGDVSILYNRTLR